jgi:hypothetical protein
MQIKNSNHNLRVQNRTEKLKTSMKSFNRNEEFKTEMKSLKQK